MGDEVRRCEVCGESECWALADWSMGGTPGEYEEAKAMHWRLGYERSQAALAAARRECEGLRSVLDVARAALESGQDLWPAIQCARATLAAPAAGEEGK